MQKPSLNWSETDAQFLEALLLATGGENGAILQDVLLMADAVDGTVFGLKEVEEALLKLVAAEYVNVRKNKLSLTEAFLQHYTPHAEATSEQEHLLQLLRTNELKEQGMAEASEAMKKYKLKNYYQQYIEQFGG
ncbi:hypothetical protein ACXYMU_17255 [Pontibacter sp. CAU 1760]